jgi:hypothetical protein
LTLMVNLGARLRDSNRKVDSPGDRFRHKSLKLG